jgi:MFS transporter, PHS family, inorganic phosphate transporter
VYSQLVEIRKADIVQDLEHRLGDVEDHINAFGFQWIVYFTTAFGFYSASYALFATNLISPALAFLYWPDSTDGSHGFDIDIATLTAAVFGMLLFGHAADRWGRKALYG